ncbi:D-aminoacyl-tRNA deacylase [Aquimarina sp. W85]|uniref:D-aminoacyl-tRNA deacylase n=1 Tax=Aquimarina rhodophyticola TaxID=3342246 RepID=UPI00366B2039
MRVVVQRVLEASVTVEEEVVASIAQGLLILVGIEEEDNDEDSKWLSAKISKLRIFEDENGLMNKSIVDVKGQVIVVSQFTLFASTKKGNRPGYSKAARPEIAITKYEHFVNQLELDLGKKVGTGIFGKDMKVNLINNGPITLLIDTKSKE